MSTAPAAKTIKRGTFENPLADFKDPEEQELSNRDLLPENKMDNSEAVASQPAASAATVIPLESNTSSPQKRTWWVWCKEFMAKYWHVGLSGHFLFITFNACIVLGVSVTMQPQDDTALSAIFYACVVSAFTAMLYIYASIGILFKGFTTWWARRLYLHRRNRFWVWYSINLFFTINWSCVTAVFYQPQRDCTLNNIDIDAWYPFDNFCSRVYAIWSFGLWTILALWLNCYFVIAEEHDETFEDATRKTIKKLGAQTQTTTS